MDLTADVIKKLFRYFWHCNLIYRVTEQKSVTNICSGPGLEWFFNDVTSANFEKLQQIIKTSVNIINHLADGKFSRKFEDNSIFKDAKVAELIRFAHPLGLFTRFVSCGLMEI